MRNEDFTGYGKDGRYYEDGMPVCAKCHYPLDEHETFRIDGEYICWDCFKDLCRDEETIQKNLGGFIREHEHEFLDFWWNCDGWPLTEEDKFSILREAYIAWWDAHTWDGSRPNAEKAIAVERDFRTSVPGLWEDYIKEVYGA